MKSHLILVTTICLMTLSCNKSDTSTTTTTDEAEAASNIVESAVTEAGSHATASEGASTPSLFSVNDYALDFESMDYVDPAQVHSTSTCSFSSARSTCSGNANTITWNGCTLGSSGATLSGGWNETWTSCTGSPVALTNGQSVTRTSPSGQTLTLASGATITTDTVAHTTYDNHSIPGTGVTVSNSSGTRTITINGIHKIMKGPKGRTWYNHSITGSLTVTGTRAGGNRVVNGTTTLYHNIASYTATHTFSNVTWGSASSCYPTSGTVSTSVSGSVSGSVSLTFTGSGQATFTATDGSTTTITLSQCN